MEKFRKQIEKRRVLLASYCCFVLAINAILNFYIPHEENFQTGFTLGLILATELFAIFFLGKYTKALKDESLLKKLYISEQDERHQFIQEKIGGAGINIIIAGFAVATIVSGFINQLIFFTLFFALFFCTLVKGSLKLYYKNKI